MDTVDSKINKSKFHYPVRVLMISLDRGLFGGGYSGDVLERHKIYANEGGGLDIIVFADASFGNKVWPPNLRVFPTRSGKWSHYRKAVSLAAKLNQENKYDLLVTQDFAAPAGARIKNSLRIPWIVSVHSMFFSRAWLNLNPINWYLFYLIRKAVRGADGFRVNNEAMRDKFLAWGIRNPILIQPTPIDIEKFKAKSEKRKAGTPKILFVGRLAPEKNISMLIQAVKNIKADFELQIVGGGPEERKLKSLTGNDPRIKFTGPKTLDELPMIFGSADIFVLPSNSESYGQVLLQAAASGCAIIATATAGAKNILGDSEYGKIIPVNSQTDLEQALEELITIQYQREYWQGRTRELASRYDSKIGVARTINFWKEIANKRS